MTDANETAHRLNRCLEAGLTMMFREKDGGPWLVWDTELIGEEPVDEDDVKALDFLVLLPGETPQSFSLPDESVDSFIDKSGERV